MTDKDKPPTLTERRAMGGLEAQEGFDYQLWHGLIRVPGWLINPAFEQLLFEGLEDFEARFFAPHAPHGYLLERHQAKKGRLEHAQVREVFERFHQFEREFPKAARVQVIVAAQLPPNLSSAARKVDRVRLARPFYAPFAQVIAASEEALKAELEKLYGDELGSFVLEFVEIVERRFDGRDSAIESFSNALHAACPDLDAGRRTVEDVFGALEQLANRDRFSPLTRKALVQAIEQGLGSSLPRLDEPFPVHIRSDRNGANEKALEIDASAFSGGDEPFPEPERWQTDLFAPLDATARWLNSRGTSIVELTGSFRLTTGFALGWSLRSATGFELVVPTKGGDRWATNDRPRPGDEVDWLIEEPAGLGDDGQLSVCIGVLRNPAASLHETAAVAPEHTLTANLPVALTSAREIQVSISKTKAAVDAACARFQPSGLRLFYAGPRELAVMLGHRWNAMPPTQLYEFLKGDNRYVPTLLVQ